MRRPIAHVIVAPPAPTALAGEPLIKVPLQVQPRYGRVLSVPPRLSSPRSPIFSAVVPTGTFTVKDCIPSVSVLSGSPGPPTTQLTVQNPAGSTCGVPW